MAVIKKKSPLPVYAVAVLWLVWGFLFPLYRLQDFLLLAGASVALLLLARLVWKDFSYTVPDPVPPPQPVTTGSPELDSLILERDRALSEMHRLNEAIEDPKISDQIDHLEEDTRKIIDLVVKQPEKLPQLRKFLNYYLPTTLKLLNAYDRMDATGVTGDNIGGTMDKVEAMMDTVVLAFDRQLDGLFRDEAMDISTDITVMEQMLAREGIGGTQLPL